MNEKNDFEVDLAKLLLSLWRRLPVVLIVSAVIAVASFFYSRTPVAIVYNGKASFFARPNVSQSESFTENDETTSTLVSNTSSALNSVDTLCYLSTSPAVLEVVIEKADLPYSSIELYRMVSARQENTKALAFTVFVQSSDEAEALQIAQAFAEYLPSIIADMNPTSIIRVINSGSVSSQSSGGADTKKPLMAAIFSAAGLLIIFAVIFVIKEYSGDNRVSTNEVKRLYPKTKILSSYLSSRDLNASKRLRTNILLSMPEKDGCKTLGLTAVHPDPEKAEIVFGLAKALSELGDRVLLIDADLRNRTLSRIVMKDAVPGLCDLIHKKEYDASLIQTLEDNGSTLSVLPAGVCAEDASELLDSRTLIPILDKIKADFDYVLLDLEPIGANIDAASVGKNLWGMLVTYRSEGCTRNQLAECMAQLEYASVNVIGFVELKKNKAFKNQKK